MTQKPHILIIRLSALGDVAMTVPVIRALVGQHPNCEVTVVSKPFLEPLFKELNNVSFFAADVKGKHKGILGLYKLFRELNKLEITHVADFHNVLRSKILRFFYSFTSVKKAVIDKGRDEKKALTRENNKVFKKLKTSVQRYADVLNQIGFNVKLSEQKKMKKKPLNSSLFEEKSEVWIGVAPFAAFEGKMYPLGLMKEVVDQISKKGKVLLFGGGKKEVEILNQWEYDFNNTINIAGKISLEEELNLISHLDVMLSMDSGNAHLAAMQNVDTVTIWGVTHPYAGFTPFNQEEHCILPDLKKYPKLPCSVYGNKVFEGYEDVMRSIPVNLIVEKISSLIKSKKET